jgi:hypothetical protein
MINNFSGNRTKIKWRGDMLVAWFADATPPVLWRWQANDISAGFGLKKEDKRTELVKHEAATGSTLIAAFPTEAQAQSALSMLSETMMVSETGTTGRTASSKWPGLIWKWISSIIVALFLIFFAYVAMRILIFFNDPVGAVMKTTSAASTSAASTSPPEQGVRQSQVQQPQAQQPQTNNLPFPFGTPVQPAQHPAAAPPSTMGKPLDADELFH